MAELTVHKSYKENAYIIDLSNDNIKVTIDNKQVYISMNNRIGPLYSFHTDALLDALAMCYEQQQELPS